MPYLCVEYRRYTLKWSFTKMIVFAVFLRVSKTQQNGRSLKWSFRTFQNFTRTILEKKFCFVLCCCIFSYRKTQIWQDSFWFSANNEHEFERNHFLSFCKGKTAGKTTHKISEHHIFLHSNFLYALVSKTQQNDRSLKWSFGWLGSI